MIRRSPGAARRVSTLGVICLVALVSSAIGVYAGQTFSDVPESHPFHDEIAWLAAKGISTGFNDGTYRPADPVTRQAMAAFLQRMGSGSPMELEPNDTMAAADILPDLAGPYPRAAMAMGNMLPGDSDYWRFTHPGGGYVHAATRGLNCADQFSANTRLTLYDANGTQLAHSEDNGAGNYCSFFFIQPLAAGDYFLRVRASSVVPWYSLFVEYSDQET